MNDIELVIKINEEDYKKVLESNNRNYEWNDMCACYEAVFKGIPLPKGHGRIGDLDAIKKDMQNYHDDCAKTSEYTRLGFETAIAVVEDANAIIEADKER